MKPRIRETKAPLSPALAGKVRELIARDGERAVAEYLQISGPTLGRASGGLAIGHGTRALIELRLQAEGATT